MPSEYRVTIAQIHGSFIWQMSKRNEIERKTTFTQEFIYMKF